MACYHPLTAYRGSRGDSGKQSIVFDRRQAVNGIELSIPCGQCVGCRLERSRQWAMRCMHEAQMHQHNSFITLTYDDDHLPEDGSLHKRDFQLFMKKLRRKYEQEKIRFYHCGEYGEVCGDCGLSDFYHPTVSCKEFRPVLGRPHYHACIFGFDFPDRVLFSERGGNRYYISEGLRLLWSQGFSIIGDVTFESAAYVARYVMKKINGGMADEHYGTRLPEYTTMSRRPGIGRDWYDVYSSDVYPLDYVVVNGRKVHPPHYYDGLFEVENPSRFSEIKEARKAKIKHSIPLWQRFLGLGGFDEIEDGSFERLAVKEFCTKQRIKDLVRNDHFF